MIVHGYINIILGYHVYYKGHEYMYTLGEACSQTDQYATPTFINLDFTGVYTFYVFQRDDLRFIHVP